MANDYNYIPEITFMTGLDYKDILMNVAPDRKVTICTYSLYGAFAYFYKPALQHLKDVDLIITKIDAYKDMFVHDLPNVHIHETDRSHAKMLLIAPDEVYLSSQNFGEADWFQHAVHIKDAYAYNYYLSLVTGFIADGMTGNIAKYTEGKWVKPGIGLEGNYTPDLIGSTYHSVRAKYMGSVNWNQKLNNVSDRSIIITTYTLPDTFYVKLMLDKLIKKNNYVTIIANSKVENQLQELSRELGGFKYHTFKNMHAKMILYNDFDLTKGDGTVLLSSQNFGTSGWFENLILIKEKGYKYYYEKLHEFTNGII